MLAAFLCGLGYAVITGKIISISDIGDRIDHLCILAQETRGAGGPWVLCSPDLNGGEIKARALWAISLGITAITGTACLIYCLAVAIEHRRKRYFAPDTGFHGWFLVLTSSGLLLVAVFAAKAFGGQTQNLWLDPIQPAFSKLFGDILSPSGKISIETMIATKIMPFESLIIAAALAIYVAVCGACVAPVSPYDPDKAGGEPNELMHLLAGRMRVLNRVMAVASAALSLAMAAVAAYSAWPAALVAGSGDAAAGPLKTLAGELAEIGTVSTLHWAASMVTIGLPAYLIAVVYLIVLAKRQAHAAIVELTNVGPLGKKPEGLAKIDLDRDAAEAAWIKARGIDMDWAAILKNAVALFSPLATGAAVSALTKVLGGE
jgi:hypothetical protein